MRALSCQIVIATFCAVSFVVAGLWTWQHQLAISLAFAPLGHESQTVSRLTGWGALWAVAAGQFLFLHLVADEARPQAPASVRWSIKAAVIALFWLALVGIGYRCWVLA